MVGILCGYTLRHLESMRVAAVLRTACKTVRLMVRLEVDSDILYARTYEPSQRTVSPVYESKIFIGRRHD